MENTVDTKKYWCSAAHRQLWQAEYELVTVASDDLIETKECLWCGDTLELPFPAGPYAYTLGVLWRGRDMLDQYLEDMGKVVYEGTKYAVIAMPLDRVYWITHRLASGLMGGSEKWDTQAEAEEWAKLLV